MGDLKRLRERGRRDLDRQGLVVLEELIFEEGDGDRRGGLAGGEQHFIAEGDEVLTFGRGPAEVAGDGDRHREGLGELYGRLDAGEAFVDRLAGDLESDLGEIFGAGGEGAIARDVVRGRIDVAEREGGGRRGRTFEEELEHEHPVPEVDRPRVVGVERVATGDRIRPRHEELGEDLNRVDEVHDSVVVRVSTDEGPVRSGDRWGPEQKNSEQKDGECAAHREAFHRVPNSAAPPDRHPAVSQLSVQFENGFLAIQTRPMPTAILAPIRAV